MQEISTLAVEFGLVYVMYFLPLKKYNETVICCYFVIICALKNDFLARMTEFLCGDSQICIGLHGLPLRVLDLRQRIVECLKIEDYLKCGISLYGT
jgi:hypothetical protein